jgi:hypothetical protein
MHRVPGAPVQFRITGEMPQVRRVQADAREDDYRFQSMISAVVRSEMFLHNEKIADVPVASAAH